MDKFEFGDYRLKLNIAGCAFDIDCGGSIHEKLSTYYTEGLALEKLAREEGVSEEKQLAWGLGVIDGILGDGASDKIFEGRDKTAFDANRIVSYIAEKIAEKRTSGLNRAQRRRKNG